MLPAAGMGRTVIAVVVAVVMIVVLPPLTLDDGSEEFVDAAEDVAGSRGVKDMSTSPTWRRCTFKP